MTSDRAPADSRPLVTTFVVGAFQENCYLLTDPREREAVLIDPGAEPDRLIQAIERGGTRLSAIWLTHAHLDHVGAIAGVKRHFDVPVYLHPLDAALYAMAPRQAAVYGLTLEQPPAPDRPLGDGDELRVGSLRFVVWHVPGHAPGHVAIHGHGLAFVGDCLFAGSIGRTDLPLSVPADLAASLARLASLPDDTVVYSGHGPATTIGAEKRSNPFLTGVARIVGA